LAEQRTHERTSDIRPKPRAIESEVERIAIPPLHIDTKSITGRNQPSGRDIERAAPQRLLELGVDLRRQPMPRDVPKRPQMAKEAALISRIERLPDCLDLLPHAEDEVHSRCCRIFRPSDLRDERTGEPTEIGFAQAV